MSHYLHGRLFDRARQFDALLSDWQEETKTCENYLREQKEHVFAMHHVSPFRTIYSVRGKHLLETIEGWLMETKVIAQPISTASELDVHLAEPALQAIPSVSTLIQTLDDIKERRKHAKEIMVAMLYHGFLALHKEWENEYTYKDSDLYIPLSTDIMEWPYQTVWGAVQNALFAAPMKRKTGLFASFTHGKDVYMVVQENKIYLYENDTIPSQPLIELDTSTTETCASYDSKHFTHGIRLWTTEMTEVLNARNKFEQDWCMHALISSHVQYRQPSVLNVSSLYEIDEKDVRGGLIPLNQYKGHVVLVVNVSSDDDPSTLLHYTELMTLDRKYHSKGLIILGCPCDQFGRLEPGSIVEIEELIKRLGIEFLMLEKRDVNGMDSRPLFTYLNTKLPGPHGNYVDWNFTKFLVDRKGQPVQRFAPDETPLSFEDVIINLLQEIQVDKQIATVEAASEIVETIEAAIAVADVVADEGGVVDIQVTNLVDEEDLNEVEAEQEIRKDLMSPTKHETNQELDPIALSS